MKLRTGISSKLAYLKKLLGSRLSWRQLAGAITSISLVVAVSIFYQDLRALIQPWLGLGQCNTCQAPEEQALPKQASLRISGSLIDVQTAAIEITTLEGSQQLETNYILALWRGGGPGLWEDAMVIQELSQGSLGAVLFNQLNINRTFEHTIGLVRADTVMKGAVPNVSATLHIPAGICPPMALDARESRLRIRARQANYLKVQYDTPLVGRQTRQWLAVVPGGISPNLFGKTPLKNEEQFQTYLNEGKYLLDSLQLNRVTTYTVLYGHDVDDKGKPILKNAIAAASFSTE